MMIDSVTSTKKVVGSQAKPVIYIVDDKSNDVFPALAVLQQHYHCEIVASDKFITEPKVSVYPHVFLLLLDPSGAVDGDGGFELLVHLKKNYPEAVFIIIAAWRDPEHVAQALRLQVHDYLFLPINAENLANIIKNHLEKRELEKALKTSAQLHWATLESIEEGILLVNKKGEIVNYNKQFVRLWRLPEDLVKMRNDDLLLAHVMEQLVNPASFLAKVRQLYESRAVERDTIYFKDGRIFDRFTRPLIKDNIMVGRLWAFRDITEELLAQKKLQDSEEKFRSLFNDALDMIHLIDPNGVIIDANTIELKKMGYKKSEYIGRRLIDMVAPEYQGALMNAQRQVFNGNSISGFEMQMLAINKQRIAVEVNSIPYIKDGEVIYARSILRDVTERKNNEAELNQYRHHLVELVDQRTRQLRESNKELESFSYTVSHDLRAPLRSIDGFCHLIYDDCFELFDEEHKDYFRRIRNSAQRMSNLIDSLLQFSRVMRHELGKQTVNLSKIAEEVFAELREADPTREISLETEPNLQAYCDYVLIRQVFSNLIGNAWKFTTQAEKPWIRFGCKQIDDQAVFFIKDNGIGIENEYADKVFGVFQRLHSQDEYEGAGIGLATVQRIIKRHGGDVWLESTPQKGACFYFTLPNP